MKKALTKEDPHLKEMKKVRFTTKNDTNVGSCYGYGTPGHMLKDCPLIQKIGEKRKFKIKRDKKKWLPHGVTTNQAVVKVMKNRLSTSV